MWWWKPGLSANSSQNEKQGREMYLTCHRRSWLPRGRTADRWICSLFSTKKLPSHFSTILNIVFSPFLTDVVLQNINNLRPSLSFSWSLAFQHKQHIVIATSGPQRSSAQSLSITRKRKPLTILITSPTEQPATSPNWAIPTPLTGATKRRESNFITRLIASEQKWERTRGE